MTTPPTPERVKELREQLDFDREFGNEKRRSMADDLLALLNERDALLAELDRWRPMIEAVEKAGVTKDAHGNLTFKTQDDENEVRWAALSCHAALAAGEKGATK